jgi:DNA transformation protein
MPVTDAAVKALLAPMEAVQNITSKKMFGGIGIYADGIFFAVIDDDRLLFKVDAVTEANYDAHEAATWVIDGNPPSPMPYREVPKSVWQDSDLLSAWITDAVGVAIRKKAPKPKASKPKNA